MPDFPAPWTPDEITKRAAALVAALDGFDLIERLPDGSWKARTSTTHFDALEAAGGDIDRYVFKDGVGWAEVRLELHAGGVRVLLHCEIDASKAAT